MAHTATPIDLYELDDSELRRLVREVRRTRMPVVIREQGEDLAVLTPLPARQRRRAKAVAEEDIQATLSVFGAWKGKIDPEAFKRRIKADREDDRPPVRL
jgi:hypothetical protein